MAPRAATGADVAREIATKSADRHAPAVRRQVPQLTQAQKAAVIVRVLSAEGEKLDLTRLTEDHQSSLAEHISTMKMIDRTTLDAVVTEFLEAMEQMGIAFPGALENAIQLLDGQISGTAADKLRRKAQHDINSDPWDRLMVASLEHLMTITKNESAEVCAVLVSKLPVSKGADYLSRLPGDRARRIAHAISQTENVDPATVRRIGTALVAELTSIPQKAFQTEPATRVGAILNYSPAATRDQLLGGLEQDDAEFAEQVRKAIFTFAHIPARILPRDLGLVIRQVDQAVMVTALAGSAAPEQAATRDFILGNISQRMAEVLREEMNAMGRVGRRAAEEAMAQVVDAIRTLETEGQLTLIMPDEFD